MAKSEIVEVLKKYIYMEAICRILPLRKVTLMF
jgi:hypothetical protein